MLLLRRRLVILPLAGLASALVIISTRWPGGFTFLGGVFGALVATYFVIFEGARNWLKIFGFVLACTAAFAASFFLSLPLYGMFDGIHNSPTHVVIPLPVYFVAGFAGAYIVFFAGLEAFSSRPPRGKQLLKLLLWAIGGGLLGVFGGGAANVDTSEHFYLLFVIWQPGAALLLGLLLQAEGNSAWPEVESIHRREKPDLTRGHGTTFIVGLFFACVVGFLGFLGFRQIQSLRRQSDMEKQRREILAEVPSNQNLPDVQPMPVEGVLLISQIGGLYPRLANSREERLDSFTRGPLSTHDVLYSIDYMTSNDPPPAYVQRAVALTITQFPNEQWANFCAKYPRLLAGASAKPAVSRVSMFGQTILKDASGRFPDGRGLCYLWPSGNFVVRIFYETPEVNEDFVRLYLAKYKSSL